MRNDSSLEKHLARLDQKRVQRILDGAKPTVGDLLLLSISGKPAIDVREILTCWVKEKRTGALNVELRRFVAREWLGQA